MGAPDKAASVSLVVNNDLSELARVSAWVNAWAQRHDVPPRTAQHLDLCSTEAVTNIITHGYADRASHQISLQMDWQNERLALEIQDDGRAFDPRQADELQPAASIEDAKIGGWGIQIVRRFSHELRYRRIDGRNHLTLVFRLPQPSPCERAME
jgi:serine/threonine-protein kinase RsbW